MSPWSAKSLRLVVQPGQVVLNRVASRPTWNGRRDKVVAQQSLACVGDDKARPWQDALAVLAEALPGFAGKRESATAILSNHFVRYALVPWSVDLSDETEELAFARHCFVRIYGEAAQDWRIRLSVGPIGTPRLASAVDPGLLDGLHAVCGNAGIKLKSIQPYLMTAFNLFGRRLGGLSAWCAVVEPGNLCLALLLDGAWVRLRSLRVGPLWQVELEQLLQREAMLVEVESPPTQVYVWHYAEAGSGLAGEDRWRLRHLAPEASGLGKLVTSAEVAA